MSFGRVIISVVKVKPGIAVEVIFNVVRDSEDPIGTPLNPEICNATG